MKVTRRTVLLRFARTCSNQLDRFATFSRSLTQIMSAAKNRLQTRAWILHMEMNADCSRLTGGVDEVPYSCEMMIVMFGDKIQMVREPHRRLQTRVGNGSGK